MGPKKKSKGLQCLYTNTDTLSNKRKELKANIATLKPDIIAITEIYPKNHNDTQSVELQLDDFDCFISGTTGRGEHASTPGSV